MMRREEGETAKTRAYADSVCPSLVPGCGFLFTQIIQAGDFRSPDPMTVLKIVNPPKSF
jgi:hypothetical protein